MTNTHAANPSNQEGETDTKSTESVTAALNETTLNENGGEREKEESSTSTGSDGGKGNSSGSGSGSGSGGYNADCSSSDSSSNNDATTQKAKTKANTNACTPTNQGNDMFGKTATSKNRAKPTSGSTRTKTTVGIGATSQSKLEGQSDREGGPRSANLSSQNSMTNGISDSISRKKYGTDLGAKKVGLCLPQWNGVTVEHPMDPRIDLSTVGFSIGSSQLAPFANHDIHKRNNPNFEATQSDGTNRDVSQSYHMNGSYANGVDEKKDVDSSTVPSPEQYTKLLECVRPFFNAHGMTGQTSTTTSNEPQKETKTYTDSSNVVAGILKAAKDELALAYASASASAAGAGQDDDENEKDSSSMVVLARPKKKHSTKQEGIDGASGRSRSSDEEERLPQPPQQAQVQQGANYEEGAVDQNEINGNGQDMMDNPQQQPQQQQNLMGDAQRYEFPPMVSEYSSSGRNGSSGASNTNMMSASGSGSGGNTGSGTGSGSNQGGSSGSGNDQGGSSGSGNDQGAMSSNGNGSSGSGNDKGSSEDVMSHNMAETSKDSSDRSSPNNVKNKANLQDSNGRFSPNPSEPSSQRRLSTRSNDTESQNAAREKKLQDKKRKRMNMRRVYEDKMEQDMGSSDSNNEEGNLCPGKPVTLDNAISFTTTAKLVVKSSPSLTVIYANAAYIRLSGIDSHSAVGNHITSFLSLPRQQLSKEDYAEKKPSPENSTVKVNQAEKFQGTTDHHESATDSKNHVAAEAAGRARAAASVDDDITDELEKLIVVSGYGKLIKVNVRCKPHNMLGRNVKVFKSMVSMKRNQEAGSDGSSLTSSFDGPYDFVACTMTISPVVSSPEIYMTNTQMTTKERKGENHQNKARRNEKETEVHQQKSKRRKHHHTMNEIIHNRKRQVISHFVIQLKPHEGDPKHDDAERGSHSTLSNGVEAGVLGLTKTGQT